MTVSKIKIICLKPVPGSKIMASAKNKIATVEYPQSPNTPKKNRAGDLTPKNILQRQWKRKHNSCRLKKSPPLNGPPLIIGNAKTRTHQQHVPTRDRRNPEIGAESPYYVLVMRGSRVSRN